MLKPMLKMSVEAYKQGKSDFENNEYNEDEFRDKMQKLIKGQF